MLLYSKTLVEGILLPCLKEMVSGPGANMQISSFSEEILAVPTKRMNVAQSSGQNKMRTKQTSYVMS